MVLPMSSYADRLAALRTQLKEDRLDGFVVPLTDEHMSEYIGSYAQRLAWLTGFQGSAGSAVVLPEEAAIFTDGRYTIQVRQQVSPTEWSYESVPDTSVAGWLKDHAPQGARIGYDPWLHSREWVKAATRALGATGAELVPVVRNPIDAVWADRPEPSKARLIVQPEGLAGQSSADKRHQMADWLDDDAKPHPLRFARAYQGFEIVSGLYRSAIEGGQIALPLTSGLDEIKELKSRVPDRKVLMTLADSAKEYKT